jgi:hypothetical protein
MSSATVFPREAGAGERVGDATAQFCRKEIGNGSSVEKYIAFVRLGEPADQGRQRGLARTRIPSSASPSLAAMRPWARAQRRNISGAARTDALIIMIAGPAANRNTAPSTQSVSQRAATAPSDVTRFNAISAALGPAFAAAATLSSSRHVARRKLGQPALAEGDYVPQQAVAEPGRAASQRRGFGDAGRE